MKPLFYFYIESSGLAGFIFDNYELKFGDNYGTAS